MGKLALIDVVRPYFFLGLNVGRGVQEVLEFLHVDEYHSTWDETGVLIRGIARIDSTQSSSPVFSPLAGNQSPDNTPSDQKFEMDWHDAAVNFRLTLARLPGSALVPSDITDTGVRAVIEALGPSSGTLVSDYPNTQFRLDLLFDLVTFTFPQLIGAKPVGAYLEPDPDYPSVKFDLPRILLRIDQDSASSTDLNVDLGTWGANDIDDADASIGTAVRMRPAFAMTKVDDDGKGGRFGFSIDRVVVDFSSTGTPPEILDKFGLGDDFKGLYLPEFRLFFAADSTTGTAGNFGARDLLIGFAPEFAVWGEVGFDVDFRGEALAVGLRLYNTTGEKRALTRVEAVTDDPASMARYRVTVPSGSPPDDQHYHLYVDVTAGAAPFQITAVELPGHDPSVAEVPNDSFFTSQADAKDLSALGRLPLATLNQRVVIRVGSRNPEQTRFVVLDVFPNSELPISPVHRAEAVSAVHLEPALSTDGPYRIQVEQPGSASEVTIRLQPRSGTVAGISVTDGQAVVPLAPGGRTDLDVSWPITGDGALARVRAFFNYDEPGDGDELQTVILSGSIIDGSSPLTSLDTSAFRQRLEQRIAAGTSSAIRIDAYASSENRAKLQYNRALAQRRAEALRHRLFEDIGIDVPITVHVWGENRHPASDIPGAEAPDSRLIQGHILHGQDQSAAAARAEQQRLGYGYAPASYRTAVASFIEPESDTYRYQGVLRREEVPEPERTPTQAPPKTEQPNWIRRFGGTLRWERLPYPIAGELRGLIDFQTAHEEGLKTLRNDIDTLRSNPDTPGRDRLPDEASSPNLEDGVVDFRLSITYDPSTGTINETLVARASEEDRDGLWSWGSIPVADSESEPERDFWRDAAGLYFALTPLAAATARDAADNGSVVPVAVALSVPVGIAALGVIRVLRITHRAVELAVSHDADELHSALLFDIETALWLNLKIGEGDDAFEIVTSRPDKPVKLRYRAVGFQLDIPPEGKAQFLPVFDSSRGYTIDLADSGSLRILPSLGDKIGDIIQILGARIARTNPLHLEVEMGLGVDLGVFSVDAFGFRLPLDPPGLPTITAIGIGVDIPQTLVGRGYLSILKDGFAGQLDLSVPSVDLRVAGGLSITNVSGSEGGRSATGVLVTLAAEFPGGIPLGGTGLSIFGFLGLFAMHHRRTENLAARNPALDWLFSVEGNPTDISGW